MIRFHLDQHVDSAIARGLALRGIDVTTTAAAGLQDATDAEHIAYALAAGRVIFTQDDDFIRFHQQGIEHAGIIYSKQGRRTVGEVIQFLELASRCLEQEEMANQLEFF